MMLDNSELVATGDWKETLAEGFTVAGGIGGGVGASWAFAQGSLVGTALITAAGAGAVGLFAAGYAGMRVGTMIGEVEVIKESILEMIESIWPIDQPIPEVQLHEIFETPGMDMQIEINGEFSDVEFYVDQPGLDAFDFQPGIDSPIERYEDAIEAISNIDIIGIPEDPYENNTCGSGIVPLVEL